MPFGFRPVDLLVLAVIALLFFGPKRLPEMGSAVGKTIKEFQKSMREVTQPTEQAVQPTLPAATVQPMQAAPLPTSSTEVPRETVSSGNTAPVDHSND